MVYKNSVEFKVYGKYALFTDPLTKLGGEKCSYQIPTYQALKGIAESIYWKPTFVWHIDKVRVMNKIKTQSKNVRPILYNGGNTLSIYSYLTDVEYQVSAHFEWNTNRDDLKGDRNENKHYYIAKRMIEKGGRRDIFLGCRECQGYVEPSAFGRGKGDFDECGELSFGLMFHSFNYPNENGNTRFAVHLWRPIMRDGIIEFIKPEECQITRPIREMKANKIQTSGFCEANLLDGYDERAVADELDSKTV